MSKLLLISHLLLGEKRVRAAEGGAPNSFGKSGETAWAALCAAHSLVGSQPTSSILVSLFYQARTYFQNRWQCATRGARGEAKLNRTLSAPPPASAIAPAATSQKFSLTIFLLRAPPEKNSKKEKEISARFRPPSIRAVRRGWLRLAGKKFPPPNPLHFLPARLNARRKVKKQSYS